MNLPCCTFHCLLQNMPTCSCSWKHTHTDYGEDVHLHTHTLTHAVTLTPVVDAVIVVVVLVVVLKSRGAAGTKLCQSAAGGTQLRAEVGHFLAGRLDGPINPVCQLFVVFHHFKDFPLRTKSTQSSMVSSGVLVWAKLRLFPRPSTSLLSSSVPLLSQFASHIKKRRRRRKRSKRRLCSLLVSNLLLHEEEEEEEGADLCEPTTTLCLHEGKSRSRSRVLEERQRQMERRRARESEGKDRGGRAAAQQAEREEWVLLPRRMCCEQLLSETQHTLR